VTVNVRYFQKKQAILELTRGRKVLHLGCIGFGDVEFADRVALAKSSLHYSLSQHADVLGVDYSARVVNEYRKLGLFSNIVVGNVERLEELDVHDKFDVILAGDIIEHVSNPGLMLEGIKRFCRTDTRVIVTTPNAFGLPGYLRFTLGKFKEGPEHVMTFNAQNLRHLLERHGYTVEEIST
jgi:2-polyprenyl-3-methyl-5-hydroxy-6-metoxy-1,4-benzoquinol methylase